MQMQDADDVRYIDADADADVDVDADALYITRSTPYVECSICAYSIIIQLRLSLLDTT